jgi:5-methyltetrahydropteroyltriglutamate--homocysteine methyltransferase
MNRLTRTVVGSFPIFDEQDIDNSIRMIVDLQLNFGIDIISDGEQRADMITYFSSIIPGFKLKGTKSVIAERIRPPEDLTKFSKIKDFLLVKNYLEQSGKPQKIKLTITGPITLGFTCGMDDAHTLGPYSSLRDLNLYADTSTALKPIAKEFERIGALVQIDEPGFAAGYINYINFSKEIIRWINELTSKLHPENTVLHVCGKLTKRLFEDVLVKFENVGTLSFAFDGEIEKGNIDIISRKVLEDHGKKLGLGCISGANETLSEPETVKSNIVAAVKKVGLENIKFIHPDCGLRVTSPEKTEIVLKNMNEGAKLFEETLSTTPT